MFLSREVKDLYTKVTGKSVPFALPLRIYVMPGRVFGFTFGPIIFYRDSQKDKPSHMVHELVHAAQGAPLYLPFMLKYLFSSDYRQKVEDCAYAVQTAAEDILAGK